MTATVPDFGGMFVILEKLISLICEEFGFDEDEIQKETGLEELAADELEIEEFVQTLESEFDVEIGELYGEMTVGELAEMIEDCLNS